MTTSLALTLPAHLSDGDHDALEDILLLARDHSADVREKRRELEAACKLGRWDATDALGAYDFAIARLWSAITPAALLRGAIIGPMEESTGALLGMGVTGQLERFLRPIFVEAGIGEDYAP